MFRVLFFLLVLFAPLTAGAVSQVKFVSETPADKPLHVTVDRDRNVYMTSKTGAVIVLGADGKSIPFQTKDAEGNLLLKKPNGIAIGGETVYITDTSRDRVLMFSRSGRYLDSFGESGSGPKKFSNPRGIFISQDVVYVADYSNDRIQVLGANGVYLQSIGTEGGEEALLKSPLDVVVDCHGLVYAIDGSSWQVKIYKPNGHYVGRLTGPKKPFALAVADDGIFVSDQESGSIIKYNLSQEQLYSFGSIGNGKVQFQEVVGLNADSSGNVYAADLEKGTLQVIATERGKGVDPMDRAVTGSWVRWLRDMNFSLINTFWDQTREILYAIDDDKNILLIKDDKIQRSFKLPDGNPSSLFVDRQGSLWVADRGESRLLKYDKEGKLVLTVGSSGSRPGFLSQPRDMAISNDGIVYVADTGNDRIEVFDSEGVFRNVLTGGGSSQEMRAPSAITLDRDGNIYVICESVVLILSPEGKIIKTIGDLSSGKGKLEKPMDLVVAGTELLVLDAAADTVKVYGLGGDFIRQFGARGESKGDFRKPVSLTLIDATHFLVSDYGNRRLQLFGTVYTPAPPTGLTATGGMRTIDVTWSAPMEPFVSGYRVYRAKGAPEQFKEIGIVKTRAFHDRDLNPNIPYHYRISAVAAEGNEVFSAEVVKAVPSRYKTSPPQELQSQSQEWSVDLEWAPGKETYLDHYAVYREDDEEDAVPELIAETKATSFSDGGLDAETLYTYYVAGVSTDGVESERTALDVETLVATKPPLDIEVLQLSNIFSNTYKIYETEGIGKVLLSNNTRRPIASLKVSLAIKEYMDFPSEIEIKDLGARETREVPLKAVFNNKILEVTEDTPVQTELTLTYYENQKPRTYSKNHTLTLYEKHRMLWSEKNRIGSFVTSKDPVLVEFTRSVVTQYGDISSPLVYAGALFEHLGQMGMTYLQHPNNPYQVTAGKTETVDYVQYPRETLKRNSGVCTDLVVLFSAAMESLGVKTKILGIPGHLFMMFSLGSISEVGDDTMNGMLVLRDGYVWVPLELTIVGAPFMKAWEVGSKTYNDAKEIEYTDLKTAWERYKPASLPFSDWRVQVVNRTEVDKRYNSELAKLNKLTVKYLSGKYFKAIRENPGNVDAHLQLGIIYGEMGELDEAQKFLLKAEQLAPKNSEVKNNLGNLFYLRGNYKEAVEAYTKAAEIDSNDPYILVNLALCHLRLNQKEKAGEAFQKASAKDPEIPRKYRAIAMELLGNI